MSNDDPFTLDMFGNTALSSGLGLGVTAFGGDFAANDIDDDPPPDVPVKAIPAPLPISNPRRAAQKGRAANFYLSGSRNLARGWKQRARDNLAAIRLSADIEAADRPATPDEQAQLIRFTGFGASDLANAVLRRPGEDTFRKGWDAIGTERRPSSRERNTPRSRAAPSMPDFDTPSYPACLALHGALLEQPIGARLEEDADWIAIRDRADRWRGNGSCADEKTYRIGTDENDTRRW